MFRSDSGVSTGDHMQVVLWEDIDGDGDPGTNASLVYSETLTVTTVSDVAWNHFELSQPVRFDGPGDVLIGVVARQVATTQSLYPAALDRGSSQQRSWGGQYSGEVPDPPTLPPDGLWGLMDDFGFPGNWLLRGEGCPVE
ncbi:MAG TPA: hypothetical protein PKZ74_02475 [Bacteroidales bacterium]|nr:hypothetical protein [Bacteroidales bacterium]